VSLAKVHHLSIANDVRNEAMNSIAKLEQNVALKSNGKFFITIIKKKIKNKKETKKQYFYIKIMTKIKKTKEPKK
jgi:hypothetical protein